MENWSARKYVTCVYIVTLLHLAGATQNTVLWSSKRGYRLQGCVSRTAPLASALECSHHCAVDQRCLSVNYIMASEQALCEMNYGTTAKKECRLNKDNKYTYYEPIIQDNQCTATTPSPVVTRCSDLLSANVPSGQQEILDHSGKLAISLHCHVDRALETAWTLVLFSTYMNWNNTVKKAFWQDAPFNNTTPNLSSYRMSFAQMAQIRNHSTMWRAVCNYQGKMVDTLDTVRGEFAELDPFNTTKIEGCKKVSFLNVRGHECRNCTALFYQYANMFLHVDTGRPAWNCTFDAQNGSLASEDNFGFYFDANEKFGCTQYANSTTSWWFA